MKSLGVFHLEDAEILVKFLQNKGIEVQSQKPKSDNGFDLIPNISTFLGDSVGEPGYLEVLVSEDKFLEAESIRNQGRVLTIEEDLSKLPISRYCCLLPGYTWESTNP